MSEVRLEDLFYECDRNGEGKIGPVEFQELCAKFDIGHSDSDVIFKDLDRDGDGQICIEDFAWGFRDFLSQDKQARPNEMSSSANSMERRNSHAWANFVAGIGEPALQKLFHTRYLFSQKVLNVNFLNYYYTLYIFNHFCELFI